jgi:hypothetical protein
MALEQSSMMLASSPVAALAVRDETTLTPHERSLLRNRALDNFVHYARFSTPRTQLFLAKVYRDREFLGLAPVTKIVRHPSAKLLQPEVPWLLRTVLGPFTKQTTYMVDSAFLGYQYASPFFCGRAGDVPVVRQCLCDHLKQKKDADNVWISEPCSDPAWYRANGFEVVGTLPMVHVKVEGHATLASYLAALGKKRRKSFRRDRNLAEAHGTSIEWFAGPIPGDVLRAMHGCLLQSAARNTLCVPYEDLLNDRTAFLEQDQQALVARVNGSVAGFFSFFANGDTLQQCHGGFDYQCSLRVKAYPNLINAAIEHAIQRGFKWVTLGPLNNEAKRRAGTHRMPMMASLWCRSALLRFFMRKWLVRKLQVYAGEPVPEGFPGKG